VKSIDANYYCDIVALLIIVSGEIDYLSENDGYV